MNDVRLITLNPGHFHAALVQKEMYDRVARRVHVYAPLGPDLLAHLQRVVGFNTRPQNPTTWDLEVHAGTEYLRDFLHDKPGNVVVLSGKNREKINYIVASVEAGLHVLADKPWVLVPEDLPKLEHALQTAESKGLIAFDIMTERFEITSILQRALVNTPEVFGEVIPGTEEEPGVFLESMHYLMKQVAGVPLRRPPWFFDVTQQGEGLTDVGTHLVDLVTWILYPDRAMDESDDVQVLSAKRWPTVMSREDYHRVTGDSDFPVALREALDGDQLPYYCNTLVSYLARGVHVKLNVLWDFESTTGGGDTHLAIFRGTNARVEVRQGKDQNYRPELFIVPNTNRDCSGVGEALRRKVTALQGEYPGIEVEQHELELKVTIPDVYRVGHEAHFAEVTRQFLKYLQQPQSFPAWENPNMLAKYFTTTQGVRLARNVS